MAKEKKCKYCEPFLDIDDLGETIFEFSCKQDSNLDSDYTIGMSLRQNEVKNKQGDYKFDDCAYLFAYADIDGQFFSSDHIKIKYCPFCGKKLVKEK